MIMRKRQKKHDFYLNEKEEKVLKEKLKLTKMSQSDYFRFLIMDKEVKEKPGEDFYRFMKDLRGLAINLNQLTMISHKNGFINVEKYESLKKEIEEIILDIKKHYLN